MASSSLSSRRGSDTTWTAQQNKDFEKALANFDRDTPERWQDIANAVGGGKSAQDIRSHYNILLEDLKRIDSGCVPIPNYGNNGEEEKKASEVSRVSLKFKLNGGSIGQASST